MIDVTNRRNQHPLLGEPRLMFEGDNVYVVYERAEMGKTYSFVCPRCHSVFTATADAEEMKKVKCPDCETYICFSAKGREPRSSHHGTVVAMPDTTPQSTHPGVLIWRDGGIVRHYDLKPGAVVIGRADSQEVSDIAINDATASRRSVMIEVNRGEQTGKFLFRLTVLRTTNAVYVNYNALYTKSSVYLNYGDTVKIGGTLFTLKEKV